MGFVDSHRFVGAVHLVYLLYTEDFLDWIGYCGNYGIQHGHFDPNGVPVRFAVGKRTDHGFRFINSVICISLHKFAAKFVAVPVWLRLLVFPESFQSQAGKSADSGHSRYGVHLGYVLAPAQEQAVFC